MLFIIYLILKLMYCGWRNLSFYDVLHNLSFVSFYLAFTNLDFVGILILEDSLSTSMSGPKKGAEFERLA